MESELAQDIAAAFPGSASAIPESFIEANPDLAMLESDVDLAALVPAYMLWCVQHAIDGRGTLIPDNTVHALAEFGRSKDPSIAHLNFKHTCSAHQRAVVTKFLHWCLNPDLILNEKQIERALKNWSAKPPEGANAV